MKLYEEDALSIKKDLAEIKEALPKLFAFAKEMSAGIACLKSGMDLLTITEKEKIALAKQIIQALAKEDKPA